MLQNRGNGEVNYNCSTKTEAEERQKAADQSR